MSVIHSKVPDLQYRPEIDGLRAIAVLPVVLFHAGFQWFQGGYVGVDVFFVISGYLITTLLIEDLKAGRFSIADFYERRAKRILPALFFVAIVCIPFAIAWMVPEDLIGFGKSLVAVGTFSSNIFFWQESDYFSPVSEAMPLLHTWSLAVEEQYYVLFPLILAAFWRFGPRRLFLGILAASLASLAVSEWSLAHAPEANFYLPHTRAWELFTGSLLALYIHHNGTQRSNLFSILGLTAVLVSVFIYDGETPFPGIYALLPVVGTALIILYAATGTWVARLLSLRGFVFMGLISYSFYLWHQPLFAFARVRSLHEPHKALMLTLVFASLALAILTWKYVETPFRKSLRISRSRKAIFTLSATGLIALMAVGGFIDEQRGFPDRNDLEVVESLKEIPNVRVSYCHKKGRRSVEEMAAGEFCVVGDGDIRYAIIGDSHAGAIFDYADDYLSDAGTSAIAVSGGYCAPLLNGFEAEKGCADVMSSAFESILENPDVDTIIMLAEWAIYTEGFRDHDTPRKVRDNDGRASVVSDNATVLARSMNETIASIESAGKNVILVLPVPEFEQRANDFVEKAVFLGYAESINQAVSLLPSLDQAEYRRRNHRVFPLLEQYGNKVTLLPVQHLFCEAGSCRQYDDGKKLLFSDSNHVNYYGAELIVNEIFGEILSGKNTTAGASTL